MKRKKGERERVTCLLLCRYNCPSEDLLKCHICMKNLRCRSCREDLHWKREREVNGLDGILTSLRWTSFILCTNTWRFPDWGESSNLETENLWKNHYFHTGIYSIGLLKSCRLTYMINMRKEWIIDCRLLLFTISNEWSMKKNMIDHSTNFTLVVISTKHTRYEEDWIEARRKRYWWSDKIKDQPMNLEWKYIIELNWKELRVWSTHCILFAFSNISCG